MTTRFSPRRLGRIAAAALLLLLLACAFDVRLKTVFYSVATQKLTKPVRLALLTDLHATRYGPRQARLLDAVRKQNPDAVLLGGDIFDDKRPYDNAALTIKALAADYPCYYVTGNHEFRSQDMATIRGLVDFCGATLLAGSFATLEVNGQTLQICGVDDPAAEQEPAGLDMAQQLAALAPAWETGDFAVLLAHRPELADTYRQFPFDLVLSGHAHGGQWRIPGLLNGLYAPHQGFFPPYAGGLYSFDHSTMVVSRGLARGYIPRIFNRPELVILDLTPAASDPPAP